MSKKGSEGSKTETKQSAAKGPEAQASGPAANGATNHKNPSIYVSDHAHKVLLLRPGGAHQQTGQYLKSAITVRFHGFDIGFDETGKRRKPMGICDLRELTAVQQGELTIEDACALMERTKGFDVDFWRWADWHAMYEAENEAIERLKAARATKDELRNRGQARRRAKIQAGFKA